MLPISRPLSLKSPITWVVVIGAIYVLHSAWTFVSNADFYLRVVDSEQYWEKKITKYEQRLDTEQKLIQESRIHIQMLEVMEPFIIQKAMVWTQSASAIQKETDYIRQSINSERDSIQASIDAVSEYEHKLIEARSNLP